MIPDDYFDDEKRFIRAAQKAIRAIEQGYPPTKYTKAESIDPKIRKTDYLRRFAEHSIVWPLRKQIIFLRQRMPPYAKVIGDTIYINADVTWRDINVFEEV